MSQSPGGQQPAEPAQSPAPRLLSENGDPRPPREWPEGQTLPHYASSVPRVEFRRLLRWAMWRFRETGEHSNLNFTKIPKWAEDFSPFIPPPATYQGPTRPTGRKPGPAGPSGERIKSSSFWKKSDPFEEPPQDIYDFPEVGMAAQDLQNYLQQYYDLVIVKVLGWGGEGIACLLAYQPPGQPPRYIVAKTPIAADGGDGLMREKQFQGKFQGAQHIMQLYDLKWFEMADMAEFGGAPLQPDLDNPPPPGSELGPPIMVSEFLSGGSLAKLITALGSKKHLKPVPNYFCWLVWMCMLRSLVEFKFPPKTHPYDVNLGAPTVGMQAETATDHIHFDLDPANYIFGDRGVGWNEDTHMIAPILKMADFGMAETVDHEELQRDPHKLWAFRVRGKYSYWAPEQFSEEWDYVDKLPSEQLGENHKVAGRYSWKVNLWQAAQSMVTLMSGMYPETPPLATRMRFTPSITGLDEHGDAQDVAEMWCYGAYVLDLGPHFDPRLLNILARCMMENPDERPSLPELLDISFNTVFEYGELGQKEDDHQEADWPRDWFKAPFEEQKPWTDRQLQAWVEEALYKPTEAPPPVDPTPGAPAANEKQQEGYRRQKQFKKWLRTRPQSEQQEIEQLPQEQYQEAYEKWLAGRVRDEDQVNRLTTYLKYREWKRAFDELKALRPNQTPAERYNAWLVEMIKHEAKAPFTEEFIRTCAHEINQYLAYQYQELIAQRNRRAAKRVKEQQQRMRQRGGHLTESDIARINRYYDENVDTYLPAFDSSVAKRISRLQRRLFGEDWHLG
ncbi:kinase-like domain-containing protein, partial [Triangularia verruculosa]